MKTMNARKMMLEMNAAINTQSTTELGSDERMADDREAVRMGRVCWINEQVFEVNGRRYIVK